MPNKMLTHKEAGAKFLEELREESGGDEKKMRALVYDFQTRVGGFPASKKERDHYIESRNHRKEQKGT
jgi:hypothetical protein